MTPVAGRGSGGPRAVWGATGIDGRGADRVNLSVPAGLLARVREQAPGLNLSAVFRDALAAKLGCSHDELTCRECNADVDRREMVDQVLGQFYSDVQWEHARSISAGGTLDGFGAVLKRVATTYGLSNVGQVPVARSTRKQREAALDAKLAELPAQSATSPASRDDQEQVA